MFKGGDAIQHCLICGEEATCAFLDSPRCAEHCTTGSIDAHAPVEHPRPYDGVPLPDKLAFLKGK